MTHSLNSQLKRTTLVGTLAFALVSGFGITSSSAAITPQSEDAGQHFFDCFAAIFDDSEAHRAACTPGNAPAPEQPSGVGFTSPYKCAVLAPELLELPAFTTIAIVAADCGPED